MPAPRGNIRPDALRGDGFSAAIRAPTTRSVEDGISTRKRANEIKVVAIVGL